ncbi:hypothetical protein [Streptomyces sp. NPDC059761]|uniref:hypothetical protein n=1 Tax=Streptomyces sp. NPDC059761 TaxID=3346937 RepID=UPI003663A269
MRPAPQRRPGLRRLLVRTGIDSISVAPDSFAAAEESRYGEDRMVPAGIRPAQAERPSAA